MGKIFYIIDDTPQVNDNSLKDLLSEFDCKKFNSAQEMWASLQLLQNTNDYPYCIIIKNELKQELGVDTLSKLKRHPLFHHISTWLAFSKVDEPVDPLSEANQQKYKKLGASFCLAYPFDKVEIQKSFEQLKSSSMDISDLMDLDQSYSDEINETTEEMTKLASSLSPNALTELYRHYHTTKGGANSLQFPYLGAFVHQVEYFLNLLKSDDLYNLPRASSTLLESIQFIKNQIKCIKDKVLMPEVSAELWKKITITKEELSSELQELKKSGKLDLVTTTASHNTEALAIASGPILSRSATSVRIKNDSLDELQKNFKRILQLRTKLSSFAHSLESEFFDEPFPKKLNQLVAELTSETSQVMDFFISLRIAPASKLKLFATRVVSQTCEQTQKLAELNFECEENLEMDQSVLDCLESCLTHILRNAIDHGLETPDTREKNGKNKSGIIKLKMAREGKENVKITVSDNGAGINAQALKNAVLKKGYMTEETINQLKEDSVYDLLFVDGLSTKEEVSDISGRGVGLGAVKESIVQLGGTIKVTSELGAGSQFHIMVPRIFHL